MNRVIAVASLLLASCASQAHDGVESVGPYPSSFPFGKTETSLSIPGPEEAPTLLSVLVDYSKSADFELVMSGPTRDYLQQTGTGLLEAVELEGPATHSYVQGLLHNARVFLSVDRDDPPRLVEAILATGASRQGLSGKWNGHPVPLDELGFYSDHAALFIETLVPVRHADARQLTTSLRGLVRDNQIQIMQTAASSNAVILRGPAAWVAGLAQKLQEVDAIQAASAEAVSQPGEE